MNMIVINARFSCARSSSSADEANGIFQVLTEQYRATPTPHCGKLLALDEAHKFMDGSSSDGLSEAIVNVARLMRHDGMRLAVSTQSPKALAPELLELVTVAVLHRFHSSDWFSYLQQKLPLPDEAKLRLMQLSPGHAVVFASQHRIAALSSPPPPSFSSSSASVQSTSGHNVASPWSPNVFELHVRPRITADRGSTRLNAASSGGPAA